MNSNMQNFFDVEHQQECLDILLYSGCSSSNGELEGQLNHQDKSKRLSQEHPQSSIFNFNQYNNCDTWRKDSHARRGTNIEIMEMDTSPMTNFHEKYNRLSAGQFFKIQHLFNNTLEGNPNQNLMNDVADQSFQSKYQDLMIPNQKLKDTKQNNNQLKYQLYQYCGAGTGTETIILKEINLIIQQLRNVKKPISLTKKDQKEIIKQHQKSFYVKFTSLNSSEQSIYLSIRITPFVSDCKIFFLIDASNKTLYQSYCNLETLYNKQSSIIRGFADETYYSIHYLVQKLKESKQYSAPDFSKLHLDPLLSQVFILQNTMQILFEISHKKQPFYVTVKSKLLIDFLQEDIINTFNLDAVSRKIQLKIESDNDVPSQICTDFEKLKFILTIIIQNYMNFIKEGQNIVISLKNQSNQSDEHDLSFINETQNAIQHKHQSALIQFSIYLQCPSFPQPGEESLRIQQIFTQSLKSSIDQIEPNKSFNFSNNLHSNPLPYQNGSTQVNISRKSSFYKSKTVNTQQKIDKVFEQISSLQVSNIMAQKLVSSQSIQGNLKNSLKHSCGLQFDKNEKGLPCVSFLVENQQPLISERETTIKLTQNADNSTNLLNRQTTDGLSPIYYSHRHPMKHKLEIDHKEDDEYDGQIQIDLNPQKIQPAGLHSFPKTKSISHINSNQNESRKFSMISNVCSTNELLRQDENGFLENPHNNLSSHKRLTTNPKSLAGINFELQAATTTAQSSQNQEDYDENHQIQNKPQNKIPKLENIPENQVLEQSRENGISQNEEPSKNNNKIINVERKLFLNTNPNNSSPTRNPYTFNSNNNNLTQQQQNMLHIQNLKLRQQESSPSRTNKDTYLQNKYLTFNKKANESSFSNNSPPKKVNDGDYYSYKDLPSSLSLSPKGLTPVNLQQEDIFNAKDQQINMFSPQDSILYLPSSGQEQADNQGNNQQPSQIDQIKQNSQKKTVEQLFSNNCQNAAAEVLLESEQVRGISFGHEINQNYNVFNSGTGRGEQSTLYGNNQTTPLFTAAQQSKVPTSLEIARTIKQTFTQTIPNVQLERKQILFVDKHQLYHNQFQQALSQYAKENEDESFQSAFTVEECISFIEFQYHYNNKFQYPYIFIDNKMLNDGNNMLTESIKSKFQQFKTQFTSQIFICSNQSIDPSSINFYGITSVLKKPITLKELEDNKIVLLKKSASTIVISQSFSPLLQNRAQAGEQDYSN